MSKRCDLLLIDPSIEYWQDSKRYDNLSLGYLASYARQKGFSTRLVVLGDFNSPEKLRALLNEAQPKLIGITALTNFINHVLVLAKILKGLSNTPVVLGGPHVSFYTSSFMTKNPQIDFVIRWEGELKLVMLLDYLKNGKGSLDSIPGLVYREEEVIKEVQGLLLVQDLDMLPFPE